MIIINDLEFEETDQWGDNSIRGNYFKFNGIELKSIYYYDPIQLKFYALNEFILKNKLGDENFNKIKPYLVITQI